MFKATHPLTIKENRKELKNMSTNEITRKIRELKELQALIDEAQAEAETIKDELKNILTENGTDELSVDVYKIRYVTVTSNRFDSKAFKSDNSELYNKYLKQTTTKRFSVA